MDTILKKIFILLILTGIQFNAMSQPREFPCPLDTSEWFQINFDVYDRYNPHKDMNKYVIDLTYYTEHYRPDLSYLPCEPHSVRLIDSIGTYYIQYYDFDENFSYPRNTLLIPFNCINIKSLRIRFMVRDTSFNNALNINELCFIQNLVFSDLEDIAIRGYNDNFKFNVNLSKWSFYESLVQKNVLETFELSGNYQDKNIVKDLIPFSNLKKLNIKDFLNYELLTFKKLEYYWTYSNSFFFPNESIHLLTLKSIDPFLNDNFYSIFTFYLDNMNLANPPISGDYRITYYSIKYLDKIIMNEVPEKMRGTGLVIIKGEDLHGYLPTRQSNDTIAMGNINNGEMIGIWRYSPTIWNNHYYDHYYNHSIKQDSMFPENGKWSYRYYNDTIAIDGQFHNGKKDAIWKFYNLEGKLEALKTFKNDKPRGLFIDYHFNNEERTYGREYEERKYYYGNRYYDYLGIKIYSDSSISQKKTYSEGYLGKDIKFLPNGDISIINGKGSQKVIEKDTKLFDNLVYKYYLKYLFPEHNKGEFPYEL